MAASGENVISTPARHSRQGRHVLCTASTWIFTYISCELRFNRTDKRLTATHSQLGFAGGCARVVVQSDHKKYHAASSSRMRPADAIVFKCVRQELAE